MPTDFNLNNLNLSTLGFVLIGIAVVYFLWTKRGSFHLPAFPKTGQPNTPFLDRYSTDFTQMARLGKIDPVIGREEEVLKLSQVLSRRTKNNALLIGEPGVGKTAIVEGLAQRIIKGNVPATLLKKRVLALDVTTMMAGTKYRGEFEERAKKIVQEIGASGRSIILFIDEVHAIIQSQGTEGAINLSDILKPALARGDLQMIGATTFVEYEKYIKPDTSFERRFQPVEVHEPSEIETLTILQGIKDKYREYHQVEFTDAALEIAVKLSKKLIKERHLPDKAIDAIDEAAAMIKVAHVHEAIPTLLYQAAVTKYPELAAFWGKIQTLDKEIFTSVAKEKKKELVEEREKLENELCQKGVAVVDAADIEKVIREWGI